MKTKRDEAGMKWVGLTLFLSWIILSGCYSEGNHKVPADLLGEWATSTPLYEECLLSITPKSVSFINGKAYAFLCQIIQVETISKGDISYYILHYKDKKGNAYRLSLSIQKTGRGPEIRFSHQNDLRWTKKTI